MDVPKTSSGKSCKLCLKKGDKCHIHKRVKSSESPVKAKSYTKSGSFDSALGSHKVKSKKASSPKSPSKTKFGLLDKNAKFEILKRADPRAVLELCKSTKGFADLCRDKSIFFTLMGLHYPGMEMTKNPKDQYIYLTTRAERFYLIEGMYADEFSEMLIYGQEAYLTFEGGYDSIPQGYLISEGIIGYLKDGYHWASRSCHPEDGCYLTFFDTKSEAIEQCISHQKAFLNVKWVPEDMVHELSKHGLFETYSGEGMYILHEVVRVKIVNKPLVLEN